MDGNNNKKKKKITLSLSTLLLPSSSFCRFRKNTDDRDWLTGIIIAGSSSLDICCFGMEEDISPVSLFTTLRCSFFFATTTSTPAEEIIGGASLFKTADDIDESSSLASPRIYSQ